MENVSYTVIRSGRKTAAIQIKEDGQIIVRVPFQLPQTEIARFVEKHSGWIEKQRKRAEEEQKNRRVITEEERREGIAAAARIIPERVAYYAGRMGVTYNRITIREQKTRWGSCSSKGNLSFNWKLVLKPEAALDYVVVHELAHRKEMNHSKGFWAIVEKELPDYRKRRALLQHMDE